MKQFRISFLLALMMIIYSAASPSLHAAALSGRTLTILYTNNTMGYLEPCRH